MLTDSELLADSHEGGLMHPTRAPVSEYDNFPQAQTMSSFPAAVHDLFRFDELLTEEERGVRDDTRAVMVRTHINITSLLQLLYISEVSDS